VAELHSTANLWTSRGGSHIVNLGPSWASRPLGWKVSDWERAIDRLWQEWELDEKKRQAIVCRVQQIVQAQLPVIHLVP